MLNFIAEKQLRVSARLTYQERVEMDCHLSEFAEIMRGNPTSYFTFLIFYCGNRE
jgi:hypothetical protein